jgi:hypothetical protein
VNWFTGSSQIRHLVMAITSCRVPGRARGALRAHAVSGIAPRMSKENLTIRIEKPLRERLERLAREDERPLNAGARRALQAAARAAEQSERAA